MICPKCGFENPSDSSFCGRCSAQLVVERTTDSRKNPTSHKKKVRLSFSVKFYEVYIALLVFIDLAIGGAIGFVAGKFCDFMENREDGLYVMALTTIGIFVGWAVGKIHTMIPKLLLIIAKDTEEICGKIDVDSIDESNRNERLLDMKNKGLISEEEYEQYRN